ncbi:MAG: hypothetical protein NVSMB9_08070 [Isosphaeraceae bacterium]
MTILAHHMAVEILGREFAPQGVLQHVCTFAALGFLFTTSAYGTFLLFRKAYRAGQPWPRV